MNSPHLSQIDHLQKQLQALEKSLGKGKENKDYYLKTFHALREKAKHAQLPHIAAKIQLGIGFVFIRFNQYYSAIEALKKALEEAENHQLLELQSIIYSRLGFCHYRLGNNNAHTIAIFQKCLHILQQLGINLELQADSYYYLGCIYRQRIEASAARQYLKEAITLFQQLPYSLKHVYCYVELCYVAMSKADNLLILKHIHKGMDIAVQANDPEGMATCHKILAQIQLSVNNIEKAFHHIEKAIELRKQLNAHPTSELRVKGEIFQRQKRYNESLACYEEVLQQYQKNQSLGQIATCQALIGKLKVDMEQYEEAADFLYKALAFFESKYYPDKVAFCKMELGNLYNKKEAYETAASFYKEVLESKVLPDETIILLQGLVIAYKGQKKFEKALYYLEEIFESTDKAYRERTKELLSRQHQYESNLKEKEMEVLQLKNRELEQVNEMKTRFFTNISHELRTPLTLILGPTESLLKNAQNLQSNQIQQLKTIRRNGKNMLNLIEEVLDISKLDAGKLQLEESEVLLPPLIRRIYQAFQSTAEIKNQDYQLSLWLEETTTVLLDTGKLEKILNNLLSNAVKYTPKGGRVLLLVEDADNKQLSISIKDTGRGIHPDDLPHIFDRFYQTRQKELPDEGGTGVGLAFVKELVEIMGGNIQVRSKWQQGSVFNLKIPYQAVEAIDSMDALDTVDAIDSIDTFDAKYQKHPLSIHQASTKYPKSILIVEDHPEMLQYIQSVLDGQYQLLTAHNGEEGWEILQQSEHDIDLIVSDVMMPEMDGFTLLEKVKQTPSLLQIPFILLTARTNMQDKLKALILGVDDYLTKPFVAEELNARIKNLLKNKRKNSSNRRAKQKDKNKENKEITPFDLQWLQSLEQIIRREINNSQLSINYLEAELNISRRQLQRRIRKITQLTPIQYIREIRMQTARERLEEGSFQTVSEVAYDVGFDTIHYFTKVYVQRFGKRPSEYFVNRA